MPNDIALVGLDIAKSVFQVHGAAVDGRAGFSTATGYRIAQNPRPPSEQRAPRERRRPGPLAAVFDSEVVPMLEACPGPRLVAVFDELMRRHPELGLGVWRTLERRIRQWRAARSGAGGDLPPDL